MAKTAKCTKCTFKKERQQQVGGATKTFYDWDVEFDNGDKGICGTMTKEAPFQLGASCEYEIEEKSTRLAGQSNHSEADRKGTIARSVLRLML